MECFGLICFVQTAEAALDRELDAEAAQQESLMESLLFAPVLSRAQVETSSAPHIRYARIAHASVAQSTLYAILQVDVETSGFHQAGP